MTEWVGFRGGFWLNLPLVTLAWWYARRNLPRPEAGERRRVDAAGPLVFGAACAALGTGLARLDLAHPTRGHALPWLGWAAAAIGVVVLLERRSSAPALGVALLRRRAMALALGLSLLASVAETGTVFLPSYASAGLGLHPGPAGSLVLAMAVALLLASEPSGRLADRFGPAPVLAGGCADLEQRERPQPARPSRRQQVHPPGCPRG